MPLETHVERRAIELLADFVENPAEIDKAFAGAELFFRQRGEQARKRTPLTLAEAVKAGIFDETGKYNDAAGAKYGSDLKRTTAWAESLGLPFPFGIDNATAFAIYFELCARLTAEETSRRFPKSKQSKQEDLLTLMLIVNREIEGEVGEFIKKVFEPLVGNEDEALFGPDSTVSPRLKERVHSLKESVASQELVEKTDSPEEPVASQELVEKTDGLEEPVADSNEPISPLWYAAIVLVALAAVVLDKVCSQAVAFFSWLFVIQQPHTTAQKGNVVRIPEEGARKVGPAGCERLTESLGHVSKPFVVGLFGQKASRVVKMVSEDVSVPSKSQSLRP